MNVNTASPSSANNTPLPTIEEERQEQADTLATPPASPPRRPPLQVTLSSMLAAPAAPRLRSFQRNGLLDEMQQLQARIEQLEDEVRGLREAVLGRR